MIALLRSSYGLLNDVYAEEGLLGGQPIISVMPRRIS
jgi:hypothetical protein